ncbi:MAG: hypothetical protein PUI88_07915 [Prevotella sp.]|nr:hypothetical protein [Prevotella sp.]
MKNLQKLLTMFLLPLIAGCLMSASCGSEDDDFEDDDFAVFDFNGEMTINGKKYYVGDATYDDKPIWGEKGIWIELPLHESKKNLFPDEKLTIIDNYHNNISEYGSGITINGLDGEGYENITVYDYIDWPSGIYHYLRWDVLRGTVSITPLGEKIKIQFHNFKFQKDDESRNYVVNGTATVRRGYSVGE